MKSQRIPEHELNKTTTVGQAIENIGASMANDQKKEKTKQVQSNSNK